MPADIDTIGDIIGATDIITPADIDTIGATIAIRLSILL